MRIGQALWESGDHARSRTHARKCPETRGNRAAGTPTHASARKRVGTRGPVRSALCIALVDCFAPGARKINYVDR